MSGWRRRGCIVLGEGCSGCQAALIRRETGVHKAWAKGLLQARDFSAAVVPRGSPSHCPRGLWGDSPSLGSLGPIVLAWVCMQTQRARAGLGPCGADKAHPEGRRAIAGRDAISAFWHPETSPPPSSSAPPSVQWPECGRPLCSKVRLPLTSGTDKSGNFAGAFGGEQDSFIPLGLGLKEEDLLF